MRRWLQWTFLAFVIYAYDASGNLAFRTNNDFLQSFNSDSVNQLQNITRAGPLTVADVRRHKPVPSKARRVRTRLPAP